MQQNDKMIVTGKNPWTGEKGKVLYLGRYPNGKKNITVKLAGGDTVTFLPDEITTL